MSTVASASGGPVGGGTAAAASRVAVRGSTDGVGDRRYVAAAGLQRALAAMALLGGLSFVVGLFVAPQRVWGGWLMGFVWITTLALAGPVLLAFVWLAGGRWATALRRVPEAMGAALPAAAVMGLVLLAGVHGLYEWSHEAAVEADALLQHKSAWLNVSGFALRMVLAFAVWIVLARRLAAASRAQDLDGDPRHAARSVRTSALLIAVFAVTWSIASFDWLMSLEPHWFSTAFGLYQFGGLGCAGLAAAILLVLHLERQGALRGVLREEHLHDLGKLLFAITLFWAYMWYCQYMLVWYTDIPEETAYYVTRQQGSWWLLVQTTLVLQWGVPFLALLSRRTCRSRAVLGRVAWVVLVGHALDLYLQVGPPLLGEHPLVGLWELLPVVGAVALFGLVTLRALERAPAVPLRDPRLVESRAYHTP